MSDIARGRGNPSFYPSKGLGSKNNKGIIIVINDHNVDMTVYILGSAGLRRDPPVFK